MIELKLVANSASELHSEMLALLAGTAVDVAGAAQSTQTTTRGRGKGKTEPQPPTAPQGEDTSGNAGTTGSDAGAGTSTEQSSAAGEVTRDSLSARIMQLGAKAGPQAAVELFGEFGAKKFSELPVDKYGEINARLDTLLAA